MPRKAEPAGAVTKIPWLAWLPVSPVSEYTEMTLEPAAKRVTEAESGLAAME